MQFQVPQFIEIEDKIFGPLTFKQFLYLAGGTGLCFLFYVYLPSLYLSALPIAATAILSLALTFYKVNERPFVFTMEAYIKYFLTRKLYIWKKEEKLATRVKKATPKTMEANNLKMPKLSQSKLKDLAWSLNVNEELK